MDTIWKKSGLLELEYCRISRAASLLNCSTEDIIHWAQQGIIELCVRVYDIRGDLLTPTLDSDEALEFLVSFMMSENQYEFISKGNKYTGENPLISVFLNKNFDIKDEEERNSFVNLLMQKKGYPVTIDGLWAFDGKLLEYYDFETPPVLGSKFSEEFNIGVKLFEFLDFDISPTTSKMMSEISFKLESPDSDGGAPFWVMVSLLDKPILLEEKNIYITKKQIEKIYSKISGLEDNNPVIKKNVTAKQSAFTISLLKDLGLTDDDLKGSITKLRKKVARLSPTSVLPEDDKSIIDWLRKGGVDR